MNLFFCNDYRVSFVSFISTEQRAVFNPLSFRAYLCHKEKKNNVHVAMLVSDTDNFINIMLWNTFHDTENNK